MKEHTERRGGGGGNIELNLFFSRSDGGCVTCQAGKMFWCCTSEHPLVASSWCERGCEQGLKRPCASPMAPWGPAPEGWGLMVVLGDGHRVGGNGVTGERSCSKGFRLLVSLHRINFDKVNCRMRACGGESWRECFWDGETREGAEMPYQALGWEGDNCCSMSCMG